MLISHRHKFIFIHVHKVAGTSISNALRPYTSWSGESLQTALLQKLRLLPASYHFSDHVPAAQLKAQLGEKKYSQYYKFAFVRNPWDWQVSLYEYILKHKAHPERARVKKMQGFEEYLHWRFSQPKHKPWNLQKNLLTDSNGEIAVDFIGRYENLHADFQMVLDRLGLEASLPHLNKSNSRDYQDYYTDSVADLFADYYRDDIEMFGYRQPGLMAAR